METKKVIRYIPVGELYPHQDNPRKDLGDLSELIESIRQQGILQNLTVVQGRQGTAEEMETSRKLRDKIRESGKTDKITMDALAELDEQIEHGLVATDYTVVIGHRRLAAAKAAGIEELPCVVAKLSYLEQVRTMAIENMQRRDLKPWEEADSFQLMLDLGDTKDTISEQTGFSKRTINDRLKLRKYDRQKLVRAIERGGTLSDYLELEKVKDEEKREEVLNFIGTKDFRNKLQEEIDREEKEERKAAYMEKVKAFAKPFPKSENIFSNKWERVHQYSIWRDEEVEEPKDAGDSGYYYTEEYAGVSVYRKKPKAEPVKRPKEELEYEKWAKETLERLKEIAKRHRKLRLDFVKGMTEAALNKDRLYMPVAQTAALVFSGMLSFWVGGSGTVIKEITGLGHYDFYGREEELREEQEKIKKSPMRMLLIAVMDQLEGSEAKEFWDTTWKHGVRCPIRDTDAVNFQRIKTVYGLLLSLGYELSEEETKVLDGSLLDGVLETEPEFEKEGGPENEG